MANNKVFLIGGFSAAGKSASLRNLKNPEGVMYLNTEANKPLPFPAKFQQYNVVDPLQINEAFKHADSKNDVHTIIVDSLTFLLDQYESQYVLPATNGMKAWSDFGQYFKQLMQVHVANSKKNVIFLAHTLQVMNEAEMVMEVKVPVKGALKNQGIEAYFTSVIGAKKMPISKLKDYGSDLLDITPQEEALGFKYVFQTSITKETVNERIRNPMGLFSTGETFIDNDAQLVLDRMVEYYGN